MNSFLISISTLAAQSLFKLKNSLNYIQAIFMRFPRLISIGLAVSFLLSLNYSSKLKIAVRTEDFGNHNLQSFKDMEILKNEFSMEDRLTLIFHKKTPLTSLDLCSIQKWIGSTLKQDFPLEKIMSGFDLRFVLKTTEGNIFYPKVFEDVCNNKIHFNELYTHPLYSMYFSPGFKDFTVQFQLMPEEKELRHGIYDYQHVKNIIAHAKKLPFEVKIGGTLFFQSSVLDGIRQTNLLNFIAGSLFILGFFYFYRSKLASITLLSIIIFTTQIIKLLMYLFSVKIDPLTSCIILMLTVAIIEDFVFLSYLIFKKKKNFLEATHELMLPSFLTSLTTAIGFGSLAFSSNPNIVQFAIWTSFGSMLEWLIIFWVLPSLYQLAPNKINSIIAKTTPSNVEFSFLSKLYPSKILTTFLIALIFLIPFIFNQANLSYSPFDMFTENHEISHFRNYFRTSKKAEGEISVVFVNGQEPNEEFIRELKKINRITDVHSLIDFHPHLKNFEPSLQRMIIFDLENSEIGKLYNSKNLKRVIAYTNSYDTLDIPKVQNEINALCKKMMANNCRTVSEVIVSKDYATGVLQTLYDSFSFCFLLIVIIIMWLTLGVDRKLFFPIILSVIWAPIALLILVILFQFKVNVITCVALSLIVGLGGDNAIQFLLLNHQKIDETVKEFGQASIQVMVLLLIVSLTLGFSYFRTTKILSLLMVISIFLMLVGDIWILNGLLNFKSKNQSKSKPQ